jgi:hypothetical protein
MMRPAASASAGGPAGRPAPGATGPGGAARRWAAIALLCLGASAAVTYPAVTKYQLLEPGLGGPGGDVGMYVCMERGEPLASIARPFRYRVLTPLFARVVPQPPHALLRWFDFSGARDDKLVQLRFGLVNCLALACTGTLLVAWCGALGFAPVESLLAALLFYTAFPVVNYGGTAMVDPWGYAFLVLGLLAIRRDQPGVLLFAGVAGMFAKETTALLVPAALLMPRGAAQVRWRVAALLPGLAAYAIFRFALYPGGDGFPGDPATSLENLVWRLRHGPYLAWIAWDGGTAFLALWPFAGWGWRDVRHDADRALARLAWLVPPILALPFLIGSNIGRIWFYAFPVMIPLAVRSLRRVLGTARTADA